MINIVLGNTAPAFSYRWWDWGQERGGYDMQWLVTEPRWGLQSLKQNNQPHLVQGFRLWGKSLSGLCPFILFRTLEFLTWLQLIDSLLRKEHSAHSVGGNSGWYWNSLTEVFAFIDLVFKACFVPNELRTGKHWEKLGRTETWVKQ